MPWRLVPLTLIVAALLAAAEGYADLRSYLVLLAVPAAAAAALATFGELVELPGGAPRVGAARLAVALSAGGLVFVVTAAAAERAELSATALVAALAAFLGEAAARTAVPRLRRAPAR